jgi:hypothetical protein
MNVGPARRHLRWYTRLLVWVVSVPVAFVLTIVPAYWSHLIVKSDVLNVFVGSGLGRYGRLAAVVLLWVIVNTMLVHTLLTLLGRRQPRAGGGPPPDA